MSERDLKERIGEMAYYVTQQNGTEPPFTGEYDRFFEKGIYVDVVSGEALFSSKDKYDSGCGWPAFSKPIEEDSVRENVDGYFLRNGSKRGKEPAGRLPSGTCVSRRSPFPRRVSVLHQFRIAAIHSL